MLRHIRHASFAAAAALLSIAPATAGEHSSTIRIETRAFYGAVVTREAGVRVYRPLPPTSKMIINPGGKTPLNLSFEEHRNVTHNHNHNQQGDDNHGNGNGQGAMGLAGGFVGDESGKKGHGERRSAVRHFERAHSSGPAPNFKPVEHQPGVHAPHHGSKH